MENEVCIEKLLETLASCVADGGSQQCFNLMGQREGGRRWRADKKESFNSVIYNLNIVWFSLV